MLLSLRHAIGTSPGRRNGALDTMELRSGVSFGPTLCPRTNQASLSECDSPLQLTNLTLNFLDKNWASEIDFVVCKFERHVPFRLLRKSFCS
jgi:hypothetical protein